jgi:phosphopantetheinyl transferase (holo-ACP synthase)
MNTVGCLIVNIGNDIIDLQVDRSNDERFARRTLTPDELAWSAQHMDELPPVCLFGVKESFYKLMRQDDPTFALKPRNIEVDFPARMVSCDEQRSQFSCQTGREFFYSWTEPASGHHVINAVCLLPITKVQVPDAESKGVREMAKTLLAGIFGFPPEEFFFAKGPGGEPVAMHEEDVLSCGLSFTHHGRYCAVAFCAEGHLSDRRMAQIRARVQDQTVFLLLENS